MTSKDAIEWMQIIQHGQLRTDEENEAFEMAIEALKRVSQINEEVQEDDK